MSKNACHVFSESGQTKPSSRVFAYQMGVAVAGTPRNWWLWLPATSSCCCLVHIRCKLSPAIFDGYSGLSSTKVLGFFKMISWNIILLAIQVSYDIHPAAVATGYTRSLYWCSWSANLQPAATPSPNWRRVAWQWEAPTKRCRNCRPTVTVCKAKPSPKQGMTHGCYGWSNGTIW